MEETEYRMMVRYERDRLGSLEAALYGRQGTTDFEDSCIAYVMQKELLKWLTGDRDFAERHFRLLKRKHIDLN